MASPQKENGYTPIANEIMDNMSRIRLSSYEWQVILVIWRKTYGWNKPNDQISLSQFKELTNIAPPHLSRALKKLVKRNIITQIGNKHPQIYSFQKNYEEYLPKQVKSNITQIGNNLLPKQVNLRVPKQVSTKDNIIKTIKTGASTDAGALATNVFKKANVIRFESLWSKYPNKDGRKAAEKSFRRSVITEEDFINIQKAMNNYLSTEKVKRGFIKNGSTWFNNWRDWINYVEPFPETKLMSGF